MILYVFMIAGVVIFVGCGCLSGVLALAKASDAFNNLTEG